MFSSPRRGRISPCLAMVLVTLLLCPAVRAGFDAAETRFTMDGPTLKLEYRLAPSAAVASVDITQNGAPVEFRHTPQDDGASGAILVMVDVSVGGYRHPRDQTLEANKDLILTLMAGARPRNLVGVYAFDKSLVEIAPLGPPGRNLRPRLLRLRADGNGTCIYRQGIHAVERLAATPATRKYLVILSDGKDEDNGFTPANLIQSAQAHGVTICAMGCPETGIDIPALRELENAVAETHGVYAQAKIGEGKPGERLQIDTAFARAVLACVNPGGVIQIPSAGLAPSGDVSVAVRTKAGEIFTLVCPWPPAPTPAPSATPFPTASPTPSPTSTPSPMPAAQPSPTPSAAATPNPSPRATPPEPQKTTAWIGRYLTPANLISAGSTLLLGLAVFVLRRRSAPPQEGALPPASPGGPLAFLVPRDAAASPIALTGVSARIGRRVDNDIVFTNDSVSGYHAEIHVQSDGTFLITDLGSGNGLVVNGSPVNRAELNDGDWVELGEVCLRFQQTTP